MAFNHDTFISPMTWRYGSQEMRRLWSEKERRLLMRRVWVALAAAQQQAGIVTQAQLADLEAHASQIDIPRALEIEKETRHDVMAEIRCFAEQCPVGGGIIHWGATSSDITDNVDVLRLRQAVALLQGSLGQLLALLADKIEKYAGTPVMAYTHIQPAEPTTLGYRFAVYAQDLLHDFLALRALAGALRGKGFKGAVGTQASYAEILPDGGMDAAQMEARAMAALDLPYFRVTTQTYSRMQDVRTMAVLAGLAASLHKLALDFRLMQSPALGEWAEPFAAGQVGSSAMPFKRNPVNMENVCSLARFVAGLGSIAWENGSQAILERSLDDSANRRLYLPEAFLACDEMLARTARVVAGMHLDEAAMARNLARFAPFAATERVLLALVAAGANRQEAHEWLRQHSNTAWEEVARGGENPLPALLPQDERITRLLPAEALARLMSAAEYSGTAPARALALAAEVRSALASHLPA